jgi:hypothetical protein
MKIICPNLYLGGLWVIRRAKQDAPRATREDQIAASPQNASGDGLALKVQPGGVRGVGGIRSPIAEKAAERAEKLAAAAALEAEMEDRAKRGGNAKADSGEDGNASRKRSRFTNSGASKRNKKRREIDPQVIDPNAVGAPGVSGKASLPPMRNLSAIDGMDQRSHGLTHATALTHIGFDRSRDSGKRFVLE